MLDTDVNLLGFDDGIYDLSVGKFRAGNPSDHLTKSVGYKYPVESGGYQTSIDQFLSMVLPKVDVREYVLDLLAQKLCGACIKRVCIHTGLAGTMEKPRCWSCSCKSWGNTDTKQRSNSSPQNDLNRGEQTLTLPCCMAVALCLARRLMKVLG